MKRYLFGLLAIILAVGAVAFTKAPENRDDRADFYFKFMGVRDSEEGNVEKWDNITQAQYNPLSCGKAHLGCKLITTSVQTIGGQTRPSAVPLVSGTNDPTTGSGVTTVFKFSKLS